MQHIDEATIEVLPFIAHELQGFSFPGRLDQDLLEDGSVHSLEGSGFQNHSAGAPWD
jgi:hypothetical protein